MRRRIVPAAVAATLVLAAMTGCTQGTTAASGCSDLLHPGVMSDGVKIGSDGSVDITSSNDILNAQRSVPVLADDRSSVTEPGGIVVADVAIYDAVTGDVLDRADAVPLPALPGNLLEDVRTALQSGDAGSMSLQHLLAASLLCTAPGDTVVLAMTAQQSMSTQLGYNPSVTVVDVLSTSPSRAEGRTRGLPAGFPAVATDETGRPGIVLPPQAAPAETRTAARIVGSGAKVTADDTVIGQALSVDWNGTIVKNTWETGVVSLGSESAPNPDYAIRDQLTGYPIGSQVVVLDAGDGNPVVRVIDILGVM